MSHARQPLQMITKATGKTYVLAIYPLLAIDLEVPRKRSLKERLIRLVRKAVSIPVVASSGAGSAAHFTEVFQETRAEAALAAGIFHREEVRIEEVKQHMNTANINVRLDII